jgi:catechol 2,3-dioxygenase-like lactoylglutathione lyase family enzyme
LIIGIRHTGVVVKDLQAGINFWTSIMGFRIVSSQLESGEYIDRLLGLNEVQVHTVKLLSQDETMIELLHFLTHQDEKSCELSPYSYGITHIALNVSNIEQLLQRLESSGYLPINEVQVSPDKRVKVCYLRGFENIYLELVETQEANREIKAS